MDDRDRLPPHDTQAERGVLGSILIDPDAIADVLPHLDTHKAFYLQSHSQIFRAILRLFERNVPIDTLTVAGELGQKLLADMGGEGCLIDLITVTPTSINAAAYAQIVREEWTRRRLIRAASTIAQQAYDEGVPLEDLINAAESAVFDSTGERTGRGRDAEELARAYLDVMEKRRENQSEISGLPTGLIDIDRLLSGLQKQDLIVVAARPGMGKTSLCNAIALNATEKGRSVGIFSLEMSADQMMTRLVSAKTSIPLQALNKGMIPEQDEPRFFEAMGEISQTRLHIDDSSMLTPLQLLGKCRRLIARQGLDLVVVDFLQMMTPPESKPRHIEVGEIARGLKMVAKELKVPVLAACQLSRAVEQRNEKRPQLSDLRDSGSIEENADVVAFIYRDDYYNPETSDRPNVAEVNVAKHRNGPNGTVELYWNPQLATFRNLQRQLINLIEESDKGNGRKFTSVHAEAQKYNGK